MSEDVALPPGVTEEMVEAGAAAVLDIWPDDGDDGPVPDAEDEVRAALTAVVPLLRDRIAREIEDLDLDDHWGVFVLQRDAVRVARGEQR